MSCRFALTGPALAVLLLLAGCSKAPGRDGYLSKGDAICKQSAAAEAKLAIPPKGDLAATARYLQASADLVDAELAQLRKLTKPKGDSGRLNDLLAREGDAIATLRKAASSAAGGQQKAATDLFNQGKGALTDVGAGLRDYGFTVCGT